MTVRIRIFNLLHRSAFIVMLEIGRYSLICNYGERSQTNNAVHKKPAIFPSPVHFTAAENTSLFKNLNILHILGSSLLKLSMFLHRLTNQMKRSPAVSLLPNVLLLLRWTKNLLSFKCFSNSIRRIVESLKSWGSWGISAHFPRL